MKIKVVKVDWLVPFLGIAVVIGSVMAATAYLALERKSQDGEALLVSLDRLDLEQQLSAALKSIHGGDVPGAAQHLDLLLCWNILRSDAELGAADAQTRSLAQEAFRDLARMRPPAADGAAGSAQACHADQAAAERILALALAPTNTAPVKPAAGVNGAAAPSRETVLPPARHSAPAGPQDEMGR